MSTHPGDTPDQTAVRQARLPYATLADWLEGRLEPADAAHVAATVEHGDPSLQAAARWLQGFLRCTDQMPLLTPPPLVRQRLRQHFRRWSEAKAILEQPPLIAEMMLLFDSRMDRPLVQVRGSGDSSAVHLAFRSDQADLVVDLHPQPEGTLRLEGQVLPIDAEGSPVFEATATGDGFSRRSVDGDELGRFVLDCLPASQTELRVSNGELMLVAGLDLRRGQT